MKTVQMTLDEKLMEEVDKVVKELGTTRSAFTRDALRTAIYKIHLQEMQRMHRQGYMQKPVAPDEFSDWETEQAWGDE